VSSLPVISHPVEVVRISATRSEERVEVGADERKALAEALGLVDIPAFSAEFVLRRDRNGVIHVDGRIVAEVVQECVVSLEPVRQKIDESVELRFVTALKPGRSGPDPVDIEPVGEDPPEILSGPILDLGPIMMEYLVLALDPYPRAPGAEAPSNPAGEGSEAGASPFAVLSSLVAPDETER
jgi:uncharacterized metal-binding protein YceD (DUF177 family)